MTDVLHRPQGLGQLFELALRIYRARFWPYFLLFFGANCLIYIVIKIPQVVVLGPAMAQPKAEGILGALAVTYGALLVGVVLWGVANNLLMAFVTLQVEHLYSGSDLPGKAAAQRLAGVALPLLLTHLMGSILTGAGFLLCLFPGFVLLPRLAFVAPTFLMEDFRYSDALTRSWLLTGYRTGEDWTSATYWRVSGILLAGLALGYAVGLLFQAPFLLVAFLQGFWKLGAGGAGPPVTPLQDAGFLAWSILGEVAGLAGRALVQPYLIIAMVLLYLDTRNRKDGLGFIYRARALRGKL
jgi:hypothetical protein